jgi:hypothetical protein
MDNEFGKTRTEAVAQLVEALSYKLGGHSAFSIHGTLPAVLGPGVYSASNIKGYQKQEEKFLGSRAQPERRAGNLTAICEPIAGQRGILNISQFYRPPRPVTGIALLYGDGVCYL